MRFADFFVASLPGSPGTRRVHPLLRSRLPCFLLAGVLLALILNGCAPSAIEQDLRRKNEWIETTLKRLSLEEKIAQMIMTRSYGYYYGAGSDEFRKIERSVKERRVGGLIFFQGDVYETALMINRMQAEADVPLLVASDFEWGTAMRIRRATRFPEAMALGATRDSSLAFAMGKAIGEETRAIGVSQDFAPVADVNVNPDNPVINTRSFGEDPLLVAGLASAFASGLRSAGVLATAKHFPGHGDTRTDSHLDLPVIPVSATRLDSVELVPFRRLIEEKIPSVMIAHVEVPAVEKRNLVPATLSPEIVDGLLGRRLGFDGIIVTDAMDMGALVNGFGSDSSAVRAVEAGVDILLIVPDEDAAVRAVANAVRSGSIPEVRIDRSVRKLLAAKWDLGLVKNRLTDVGKIPERVATPDHLSLAREIARRSITLLKNDGILPYQRLGRKSILDVIVADAENYRTEINRSSTPWPNEAVGDYFSLQMRRRYGNITTMKVDPTNNTLDFNAIREKAAGADELLLTIFSKARSGSGEFGIPEALTKFVNGLIGLNKPSVVIAMGSPYILSAFPKAGGYLCTYSDGEATTEATVEALFGEVPVSGRLPVTIPGLYPYGAGLDLNQAVLRKDTPESAGMSRDSLSWLDTIVSRAVRDSAFPGAEVSVIRDGASVFSKAFGTLEYGPGSQPVNLNTMYDLASLTKVIATTPSVMRLIDEKKISLDDSVIRYIPEFANHGKEGIRIRNLLLHNGGLPPFKRLYLTCTSPQQVLDSVYQTEMIYRTGDSTVYSDFDFIVLGKIVDRVSGTSLDRFADSVFFKPLGMTRTMFRPPPALVENIAPTEVDTVLRKGLVRGVVHDENAYTLGGVSGHAGLFSTASDLGIFMQMMLNGGSYGGRQYLNPETVRMFTSKQSEQSTRALGWDTKTMNGYSTAGSLFGERSFGHTGFTGTSVWADPDKKLIVVFLTNRVHPTRANTKIMRVRPLVHDAVVRAITSSR